MRGLHQTHPGRCDKGKFVLSLIWVCLNIGLPLANQESNRIHHHVHFQQWLFSVVYTPGIFRDRPWWTHIYLVTLHLRAIRGAVWLALKSNWLNNQQVGKMKHTHTLRFHVSHWWFHMDINEWFWIISFLWPLKWTDPIHFTRVKTVYIYEHLGRQCRATDLCPVWTSPLPIGAMITTAGHLPLPGTVVENPTF